MHISKHLARLFAVVLVAGGLTGCGKSAAPAPSLMPAAPVTEDHTLPTQAQPKLRTMKIFLGPEVLDTELALSFREQEIGMMFRTNIQDTDAMLFVLPQPQRAAFWMTNCPESISAAYITVDGTIAEIHHLEHDDAKPVYASRDDIVFVLETQDGWFDRHHIAVGTLVRTEKGSLADMFLRRRR